MSFPGKLWERQIRKRERQIRVQPEKIRPFYYYFLEIFPKLRKLIYGLDHVVEHIHKMTGIEP